MGLNIVGVTEPKQVVVEDLKGSNTAWNKIDHDGLLDPICSTVHVFYNWHFLSNIRESKKTLHLFTNAGKVVQNQEGDLPGLGTVWYHPDGIANMLSFNGVSKPPG